MIAPKYASKMLSLINVYVFKEDLIEWDGWHMQFHVFPISGRIFFVVNYYNEGEKIVKIDFYRNGLLSIQMSDEVFENTPEDYDCRYSTVLLLDLSKTTLA